MEQGRRGRTQKNAESYAAVDGNIGIFTGSGNVNRLEGGNLKSESCKYLDNRNHTHGRNDAFNVDRRTNHGAGRGQRNIIDNFRRNSSGIAKKYRRNIPIFAGRNDQLLQRVAFRNNRSRNDSVCNIC